MGPLTHSPAQISGQLLTLFDNTWPIFVTTEPDTFDECITIKDTEGVLDGRSQLDGTPWDHWGLQFRIRSSQHTDGWIKANKLRNFLCTKVAEAIVLMPDDNGLYLVWAYSNVSQVLAMGRDMTKTKRSNFVINARAAIRELVP